MLKPLPCNCGGKQEWKTRGKDSTTSASQPETGTPVPSPLFGDVARAPERKEKSNSLLLLGNKETHKTLKSSSPRRLRRQKKRSDVPVTPLPGAMNAVTLRRGRRNSKATLRRNSKTGRRKSKRTLPPFPHSFSPNSKLNRRKSRGSNSAEKRGSTRLSRRKQVYRTLSKPMEVMKRMSMASKHLSAFSGATRVFDGDAVTPISYAPSNILVFGMDQSGVSSFGRALKASENAQDYQINHKVDGKKEVLSRLLWKTSLLCRLILTIKTLLSELELNSESVQLVRDLFPNASPQCFGIVEGLILKFFESIDFGETIKSNGFPEQDMEYKKHIDIFVSNVVYRNKILPEDFNNAVSDLWGNHVFLEHYLRVLIPSDEFKSVLDKIDSGNKGHTFKHIIQRLFGSFNGEEAELVKEKINMFNAIDFVPEEDDFLLNYNPPHQPRIIEEHNLFLDDKYSIDLFFGDHTLWGQTRLNKKLTIRPTSSGVSQKQNRVLAFENESVHAILFFVDITRLGQKDYLSNALQVFDHILDTATDFKNRICLVINKIDLLRKNVFHESFKQQESDMVATIFKQFLTKMVEHDKHLQLSVFVVSAANPGSASVIATTVIKDKHFRDRLLSEDQP